MLKRNVNRKTISVLIIITVMLLALNGVSLACQSAGNGLTGLTILHTNDTHSNLDAMSRIATVVHQIRTEEDTDNVLLVDSGNVFTGTLYFTLDQGQSDFWLMRYMGYEAMGLGSHEFDKGPGVLADFVNNAGFPVLCANFDFSKEPTLAGKIKPWTIIKKGSEKYGIFALTPEDTAQLASPGENIIISDHIQAAQQAVSELKKQGINKIIALTSIGWEKDLELAAQVKDIDIIIGGRTNTVPETYPAVINQSGIPTLVVQAGSLGKYLGQLNVNFDKNGVLRNWDDSHLITIDENVAADANCTAKLAEYQKPINELLQTVVGQTLVDLDGEKNNVRTQETNLGNLVADAMLSQTGSLGATIAIVNGGAIRSSVPAGDISLGQIREIMPYGNYLVVLELNGQQIIDALENGVSQVADLAGRFPQVSGIRYSWNPDAPAGGRIVTVEVKSGDSYQPIDTSATYRVATNDFLARGGDGYTSFLEAGSTYNTGLVDYEVLHDYIQANSPLSPGIEGRINQTLTIVEVITMSIIDESFDGKEIEVPAGETFQVQLASNASTGFSWQLISISDSNVLEKVSNIYDTPMFKLKEGEPPPVGAGGMELWDYKALKTGTSTIVMEYSQPWEGGTKAARQFTLTVTVK